MKSLNLGTFSITARCKNTGKIGTAVCSAKPGVGGLAPYVKAGIGAVVTQARVNPYIGIDGLVHLANGLLPEEVIDLVKMTDEESESRQIAIVDSKGRTAAVTGKNIPDVAGHYIGDQFVVIGNLLANEKTIPVIATTFEANKDEVFPKRLLAALMAGQEAGGDSRGKKSAALYVVNTQEYPVIDLRVDEHDDPVIELQRIYDVCEEELFPYIYGMPQRNLF